MLKFLKKEANRTTTENGAITFETTQSDCLDLFATIGALRNESEDEILARFNRAWAEDADTAMKTLFFARDIRGGLGERKVFRTILRNMAQDRLNSVEKNLWAVSEFGRYDDLLCLLDTPAKRAVLEYIKKQLDLDSKALDNGEKVSLMGKWLPSINASNVDTKRYAKMISNHLGLTDAEYRKILSKLRANIAIIENNLRVYDYTFDYGKQPSNAMFKYRQAFLRNDEQRYKDFLSKVEKGEATLHTGTLLPYEIIAPALNSMAISDDECYSMDVTWKAQKDFTNGKNSLVVVDGSGSMHMIRKPSPIAVALSLGVYFAERNKGAFHNHFITFSEKPRLVSIKGKNIYEKVKYAVSFNEVANTNIQKVFELILNTAVKNKVSQAELPEMIYFISDMEFDECTCGADITNFEYAKKKFEKHGYQLPTIIFWNVASRNQQQPVTMNEKGVVLVSGATPRIFSMISSGDLSPYAFMLKTLNVERYEKIIP